MITSRETVLEYFNFVSRKIKRFPTSMLTFPKYISVSLPVSYKMGFGQNTRNISSKNIFSLFKIFRIRPILMGGDPENWKSIFLRDSDTGAPHQFLTSLWYGDSAFKFCWLLEVCLCKKLR